jgi:ABC-type branched-subunit amino acid transport system ATPase component
MTAAAPVLEAREVAKYYGGVKALESVSLTVANGETVGLIGPNGSGKTTLMSILVGVTPADAGSVLLNADEVTNRPSHSSSRRALAATFQRTRLFNSLTVRQNVELGLFAKGRPRSDAAVGAAMERCNVAHISHLHAYALSGGQRRLTELARALAIEPGVLLLDEPTSGVDARSIETMSAEIDQARGRGVASLIVSHDLPWTFERCDRIVVLDRGRIVLDGPPDRVREDPRLTEAYIV